MTLSSLILSWPSPDKGLSLTAAADEQAALVRQLRQLDRQLQAIVAVLDEARSAQIQAAVADLQRRQQLGHPIDAGLVRALHEARLLSAGRLERLCTMGMDDAWQTHTSWENLRDTAEQELRAGELGLVLYGLFREHWTVSASELLAERAIGAEAPYAPWARRLRRVAQEVSNAMMRSSTVFPCFDGACGRLFIGEGWLPEPDKIREFARNLDLSHPHRSPEALPLIEPLRHGLEGMACAIEALSDDRLPWLH